MNRAHDSDQYLSPLWIVFASAIAWGIVGFLLWAGVQYIAPMVAGLR